MHKNYLVWILPIAMAVCHPVFADCDNRDQLYAQANQEGDDNQALQLLQQIDRNCFTYAIHYLAGGLNISLRKPDAALEHLNAALKLAETDQHAKIYGLMAQAYALKGDRPRAHANLDNAVVLATESNSPDSDEYRQRLEAMPEWFKNFRKSFTQTTLEKPYSSKEIKETLTVAGRFSAQPKIDIPILFDLDSDQLTAEGRKQAVTLANALEAFLDKGQNVMVFGHTDEQGEPEHNQALSERRAEQVTGALKKRFPQFAERFSARGKGETELKFPGHTEADHRLNRRVEVRLLNGN